MKKGNSGIVLWFYAMTAFVLAILGQTLLCGLLLGFVILVEKDEWLSKQTIQAFFLSIINSIVGVIVTALKVLTSIPLLGTVLTVALNFISGIISIVILVFAIIGIVRVCKGLDAEIPGFASLANKAFGIVAKKVYTQAAPAQPAETPRDETPRDEAPKQ